MKDLLQKSASTLRKTSRFILIVFCLLFLLPYGTFYIYTLPLRMKASYSRDIIITFLYEGEKHIMSPTVTCINYGPTINEGSMEWYTDWGGSLKNDIMKLDKDTEARFWFNGLPEEMIEKVFQKKGLGNTDEICDIVLNDDNPSSKIDPLMKISNKEDFLNISLNRKSFKEILKELPNKKYYNTSRNLMNLRDTSNNKDIDLQIQSIQFSDKKIIKTYGRYLPFFLDPESY